MNRRVAELDGFRGLAIGLVLVHHFFAVPGGWAGVDIFFVLSGYLITSILRAERTEANYWKIFYVRRATRILPAFLITLGCAALLFPLQWHILWPYIAFFGANLGSVRHYELFGPLAILWSLAVEEHFYFFWPLCTRFFTDRVLGWTLAATVFFEPVIRVLTMRLHPMSWAVFYELTPFHLDGIALGSLLSIVLSSDRGRNAIRKFLGPALAGALLLCVLAFGVLHQSRAENMFFFLGAGYSLIALTAGLLLAYLVLCENKLLRRIFSWQPLCFLGTISYSLYLYHLLVAGSIWDWGDQHGYHHHQRLSILALPLSIALAWLSFRFVETPFLEFGRRRVGSYRTLKAPVTTTP